MRVLVCGSRTYRDQVYLFGVLDNLHANEHITTVIQGEALGADNYAKHWAIENGIEVLSFPADWERHGKAAGPIRNHQMLVEGKPDLVICFVDKPIVLSRGTNNMRMLSERSGVPVVIYQDRLLEASSRPIERRGL